MKRPLSVTLIAIVFIVAGIVGVIYHANEWKDLVVAVRVIAIIGGINVLRGSNIARWVLVAWIVYHVVLSFFHSTAELVTHIAVTIVVLIALFNPKANLFFNRRS